MAARRPVTPRPVELAQVPDVKDPALQRAFDVLARAIRDLQQKQTMILSGEESPEGVVAAPAGWLYVRTGDTAGARLFVKESGDSTTGWIAK